MKHLKWFGLPAFLLLALALPEKQAIAQSSAAPQTSDGVQQTTLLKQAGSGAASPNAAPTGELPYDQYMRLGYAASQGGDLTTAMVYFQSALAVRPGDRLATIAYWNMVDQIQRSPAATQAPQTTAEAPRSTYDQYMNAGYEATTNRDYQNALSFFQLALNERPNDPYATQAIRNVSTYLQQGSTVQ